MELKCLDAKIILVVGMGLSQQAEMVAGALMQMGVGIVASVRQNYLKIADQVYAEVA